jgi:general L-amino acid transport system substrate-binding protein
MNWRTNQPVLRIIEPRLIAARTAALSAIRGAGLCLAFLFFGTSAIARPRLQMIQQRGFVTCGIFSHVAGFAELDSSGRYVGFDIDICRALSAAIFGTPDKVKYVEASSVTEFRKSSGIDVVSRRLTWELRREAPLGLLFGPVMFYDGQGFLVAKELRAETPNQLSGVPICVAPGTFDSSVTSYFQSNGLSFVKVPLASSDNFDEIREALAAGRCRAYTADITELGAIHSKMLRSGDFEILNQLISKEPLAQLVRQDDIQFFDILRWTVNALIYAEELGITSKNVDDMRNNNDRSIQLFLGAIPGNGKALHLPEDWAYKIIKTVGNYGEVFDRNVGNESPIRLNRGLNRLWKFDGLMYAPPLR